jgi:hypothetical protein
VGAGRFAHGPDNAVFGHWNRLVAVSAPDRWTLLPGHGGEIIPGALDDHVARLRALARGAMPPPVQVDLDASMACPSACSFCFSAPYRATRLNGRLLDGELLLTLIRQWAAAGVKLVRFDGGGDPLTHPRLSDAVALCGQLGLRTAVLTAGDLLSSAHLPVFLAARTYLRVSLNAARDATRRTIHRQRGPRYGVTVVLRTVAALSQMRDAEFGPQARILMPLGATSMIHPDNAAETLAIARAARDAGFDHLSFRVILGQPHRATFTSGQRGALQEQFERITAEVAGDGFQVFLPTRDLTDTGYVPGRWFSTCRAATHRALVEVGPFPDRAAVVPCGRYRGEGYRAAPASDSRVVLGELDGRTTLADVYASPTARTLLATFPSACGDCIDRSANVMLERMAGLLSTDPTTAFHPFQYMGEGADA